MITRSEKIFY